MTLTIKQQVSNAIGNAMDCGKAFSWIKNREVQKGVYLHYSQVYFQNYEMVGFGVYA